MICKAHSQIVLIFVYLAQGRGHLKYIYILFVLNPLICVHECLKNVLEMSSDGNFEKLWLP